MTHEKTPERAAMLTPAQAGKIIGMDPQYIRIAARDCPERLPFPVIRSGNRTHIPAAEFYRIMGVEEGDYDD